MVMSEGQTGLVEVYVVFHCSDMKPYLGLPSTLLAAHLLRRWLLSGLVFLLGGWRDGGLQFSLAASLLRQQLRVDVGQDSARCDGHTFQQLRQGDKKVKKNSQLTNIYIYIKSH